MPMAATPAVTPLPNAFSERLLKPAAGFTVLPAAKPSGPPLKRTDTPNAKSNSTSATRVTLSNPAARVIE